MSNHLDTFDIKDCKVRSMPFPVGGQHVGVRIGPIFVHHIPTGISAVGKGERSQHKNREKAVWEIMLKLEEMDNEAAFLDKINVRKDD